ncbi:MAG: PilZ domain-containing protein [Candidatus Omnitrophota bacterium]|nr:MAG: PilZ domain-containing protein [Candidatus Omnitrophota bacterium]
MNEERRAFKRLPVELKTHCIRNLCGKSHEYFPSFAKNISFQGMHLISSKDIGIGERLDFALEVPIYFIPLLLHGEAKWVIHKNGLNNNVVCGFKFFKMEPIDYKRLKNYLISIEKEYFSSLNEAASIREDAGILQEV